VTKILLWVIFSGIFVLLSLFQNPVGFEQAPGKTGQNPGFSVKSREAVPKTEVLEQPLLTFKNTAS
jgi:hypothetical protein